MIEIIKSMKYDHRKLEMIQKDLRSSLREIYRPKENVVFEKTSPNEEAIIVVTVDCLEAGTAKFQYYENRLHVLGLGVSNTYRRKGICKKMIAFAKKEAKKYKMKQISLYTIRETGNVGIFQKMGFVVSREEITEDFESDTFDVLHEVYMVLEIEKD